MIDSEHPDALRLLQGDPPAELVDAQLGGVGFDDPAAALVRLRRLGGHDVDREALARCLPMLLVALADSPTPDGSLVNFERFAACVEDRREFFDYLAANPRAVEILVRLFVGSQFLTEILLRNPRYLVALVHHRGLAEYKSRSQFRDEGLATAAREATFRDRFDALRRFQHWELLRIGACDSFGLMDLKTVTVQLSLLADALVQCCLHLLSEELGIDTVGFCVLAFGKLGGEELNYSSDIDLVFLASDDPTRFWGLGQKLIAALNEATGEGFLYRVDMRLRPWGRSGSLVNSVDAHVDYLVRHGQPWERQALLKARCIAGDEAVGETFLERVDPLIFAAPIEECRANARAMKALIEARLEKAGRSWGEVKSGEGSIRDVEFVTQFLQLAHGRENRHVKSIGTLNALVRLTDLGHLHADEYRRLAGGYVFLRTIEHALQLRHHEQTHAMPDDRRELDDLARRLDYPNAEQFLLHYGRHTSAIRAIYDRYLGDEPSASDTTPTTVGSCDTVHSIPDHVARMQPGYVENFTEEEIDRHARMLEQLTEDRVAVVEAVRVEAVRVEERGARVEGQGERGGIGPPVGRGEWPGQGSVEAALRGGPGGSNSRLPLATPGPARSPAPTESAREPERWRVTVAGYDHTGDLAVVAGMLYVYGFNIVSGHAFSDEQLPSQHLPRHRRGEQRGRDRIFVDVFDVDPPLGDVLPAVWERFERDLCEFASLHRAGEDARAQGQLAKRIAGALRDEPDHLPEVVPILYPVEIEVDNESATRTMLHIRGEDTKGFLYELANALALTRIDVSRLVIRSQGNAVFDTLYVTDTHGEKITDPERLRELRAAIVLIKHFSHLLPHSPNPETALLQFRDFLQQLFGQPNWTEDFVTLERSEVLGGLARMLGVSTFLWEDFLRLQHDNLFPVVGDPESLVDRKRPPQLVAELEADLARAAREHPDDPEAAVRALNAFKDREIFRTDMRNILGHVEEFGAFSRELTDLAEVVVDAAYRICESPLRARYGTPRLADGRECPLAIAALGKCGGRELGYASDIELMFVYEGDGRTDGRDQISNAEYFQHLVEPFTRTIRTRQEGIFQVDLRLRPYGKAGSLAVPFDAFRRYFEPEGPAWPYERQALVKLRPIAGDPEFGQRLVDLRDELVYTGAPFDATSMRALREKQVTQLVEPGTFNAKLSPGGLVDAEYLVQALQITHGHEHPQLRTTNTRKASKRLEWAGLLSPEERQVLRDGYIFHRLLIDALRMVRGNARDLTVPPPDTEEFEFLARRLGYGGELARLRHDIDHWTNAILDHLRILDRISQ